MAVVMASTSLGRAWILNWTDSFALIAEPIIERAKMPARRAFVMNLTCELLRRGMLYRWESMAARTGIEPVHQP